MCGMCGVRVVLCAMCVMSVSCVVCVVCCGHGPCCARACVVCVSCVTCAVLCRVWCVSVCLCACLSARVCKGFKATMWLRRRILFEMKPVAIVILYCLKRTTRVFAIVDSENVDLWSFGNENLDFLNFLIEKLNCCIVCVETVGVLQLSVRKTRIVACVGSETQGLLQFWDRKTGMFALLGSKHQPFCNCWVEQLACILFFNFLGRLSSRLVAMILLGRGSFWAYVWQKNRESTQTSRGGPCGSAR